MTPTAAIAAILRVVDGIEVDADASETCSALLAAGTSICGIALMLVSPAEREALLAAVPDTIVNYIRFATDARRRAGMLPPLVIQ